MKSKATILMTIAVALALPALSLAKHHEEESLNSSDVPAAVQKTAEAQAKDGKIVRWEKEGKYYEAVIEKDGKQWGVKMNAKGRVVSKHEESKEHGEQGEKH